VKSVFIVLLSITRMGIAHADMQSMHNLKWMPAIYHQELKSTCIAGARKGQQIIESEINTGVTGINLTTKYLSEASVDVFNKVVTTSHMSPDGKNGDTFTVTLHRSDNPQRMSADFEHIIYEGGNITLKFSGTTILGRCSN